MSLRFLCATMVVAAACRPVADSGGPGDSDAPGRRCVAEDPPDDLPEAVPYLPDPAYSQRVVELPSQTLEQLHAVIYFPADPEERAYDDGAPVAVVSRSAVRSVGTASAVLAGSWGIIEVQPIYPGWSAGDVVGAGSFDQSGPVTAAALADTIRFAAGLGETVDGTTLRQLTGGPVCDGVVVAAASAGLIPAAQALAGIDDGLEEAVIGLSAAESPHLPQIVTGDLGLTVMDPDLDQDADGNGVAWDDFRNTDFEAGGCDDSGCVLSYDDVAWSDALSLSEVYGGLYEPMELPGLLYLDRNGSGQLDLHAKSGFDLDRDGGLDADEDMPLVPWYDPEASEPWVVYSGEVISAALERGVLDPEAWPGHLLDPGETEAFWEDRSVMARLPELVAAAPEALRVQVVFTEMDHSVAQISRPHVMGLYEGLRRGGVPVRYNPSAEALGCIVEPEMLADWGGELPWDEPVEHGELVSHGLPETVPMDGWRGGGAVGLLWELLGPFDRCPVAADAG